MRRQCDKCYGAGQIVDRGSLLINRVIGAVGDVLRSAKVEASMFKFRAGQPGVSRRRNYSNGPSALMQKTLSKRPRT